MSEKSEREDHIRPWEPEGEMAAQNALVLETYLVIAIRENIARSHRRYMDPESPTARASSIMPHEISADTPLPSLHTSLTALAEMYPGASVAELAGRLIVSIIKQDPSVKRYLGH